MCADYPASSTRKRAASPVGAEAEPARQSQRRHTEPHPSDGRSSSKSSSRTPAKFRFRSKYKFSGDVPELWECWLEAVDEESKIVYMYGGSPHSQRELSPILWACNFMAMKWTKISDTLKRRGGIFASCSPTTPLPAITEPGDMLFFKFGSSKFLLIVGGTVASDIPGSPMRLVVIDLNARTWEHEPIEGKKVPTRHDAHAALVREGPCGSSRIFIFGGKHIQRNEYQQNFCSAVFDPTSQRWHWELVDEKLPAIVPKMHSSTVVAAVRGGKSILITRGWPINGSNQYNLNERSLVEYLVDSGQFLARGCVQRDNFPQKFDALSLCAAPATFGQAAFLTSLTEVSVDNPNPLPEIHQYIWSQDGSTAIRCLNARQSLQQYPNHKKWQIHAVYFFNSGSCYAIGSETATQSDPTLWNLAIKFRLSPDDRPSHAARRVRFAAADIYTPSVTAASVSTVSVSAAYEPSHTRA